MLSQFLNHKATITRKSLVNTDWIEKEINTTVYLNIPCHIYRPSGRLDDTNVSVNTKLDSLKVMVEWTRTNIKISDYIEITDPDLWMVGKYQVIIPPKANRLINGVLDSIELLVNAI